MNMGKLTNTLRERYKFYIVGYIIGYVVPFLSKNGPVFSGNTYIEWNRFIPINLVCILTALGLGTMGYYGYKLKLGTFAGTIRGLKYMFVIFTIVILAAILQKYLKENFGIDIRPFTGFYT